VNTLALFEKLPMRWTVRTQLTCLVALMSLLMAAIGVNAYLGLAGASTGLQSVLLSSRILRNHIESDMMHDALRADVLSAMLAGSADELSQAEQDLQEHAELFRGFIAENNSLAATAETKEALAAVGPSLQTYIAGAEAIVAAARSDKERARQMMPTFIVSFRQLEGEMSNASDVIQASATTAEQAAQKNLNWSGAANLFGLLIAIALGVTLATLIVRGVLRGVASLVGMITPMANGELGAKVAALGDDEFGQLLTLMQGMDAKLSSVVGKARQTGDSLSSAAAQLSQGNDDLNQRTQEQAAALEETAASMEQMATTVKRNATNARLASKLALDARAQADQGGGVVNRAISAMDEINSSSRRIADIIGTINEIAFQTNLLALNAAVEAARAGEQGRGFAVVASEVRNLAQRSASAAREIKDLISDSVSKVSTGTELVHQSGKTINNIMDEIRKVTDIVAEIASASEHQAEGIEQVNRAMSQMDTVTQQNAALVEENAAASKLVSAQSEQLTIDISFFRLPPEFQLRSFHESATAAPSRLTHDEPEPYRLAG
jgi:methyl-accepting chemotaxis protein